MHVAIAARAFSGKMDTGFPQDNATKQKLLDRFPIQSNWEAI